MKRDWADDISVPVPILFQFMISKKLGFPNNDFYSSIPILPALDTWEATSAALVAPPCGQVAPPQQQQQWQWRTTLVEREQGTLSCSPTFAEQPHHEGSSFLTTASFLFFKP